MRPKIKATKSKKESRHEARPDSREALISAAKSIFARHGYDRATVKDLADAAGINVSLVSYYFGGKDGLYRAALERFGLDRLAACERILKPVDTLTEFQLRLKLFADEFVESHITERDVCTILHRDFDGGHPIALEVFKDVFVKLYDRLCGFVGDAQKSGVLKSGADIEISTSLMFGGLVHMLRSNEIRKMIGGGSIEDPEFRRQVIEHFVQQTTHGLAVSREGSSHALGGAK